MRIAQTAVPWKILSEPRMSKIPYLPRIKRRLFFGGLFSLLVGIIVALIRNQLDTKFHEPEDIAKFTNLPSLGYVPFIPEFQIATDDFSNYKKLLIDKSIRKILLSRIHEKYNHFS